jgi:pimeloyl-ACP methyl ester carboxylesterase
MKTDLHFSEIGQGEPIMFIHGGFDPAEETFGDSRSSPTNTALFWSTDVAMGESPASDRLDFDAHAEHTMRVVGEGAHLVGQSYGGLLCLLAAAAHPQAVWTLTVIEPIATSIARGDEAVERLVARLAPLFPPDAVMSSEQFAAAFYEALGFDAPSVELDERRGQPRRPPHANQRPGTLKCRSIASRLHPFENSSSPVPGTSRHP